LPTSEVAFIQGDHLFDGFSVIARKIIMRWRDRVVAYGDWDALNAKLQELNAHLADNNVMVLFDHHYAFDAIPLGFGLAQFVENVSGVLIPYSVHLDMGVGRAGEPSLRYFLRTLAHKWLKKNIQKPNPAIQFFPVVREFEIDTPGIHAIVEKRYSGVNTTYLKSFVRQFKTSSAGQVCFLTPFSGIGFPGKPLLHPQLYRSIDDSTAVTQAKQKR